MIPINLVHNQPTADSSQVRDDLHELREWLGLDPTEIAAALEVRPEQVRRWLRGQQRPANFVYVRLLALKRFAHTTWVAMPFNTIQQRHDWWVSPVRGYGAPQDAFRIGAYRLIQSLIVNDGLRHGRAQVAAAA